MKEEVIITRKDGSRLKLVSICKNKKKIKSPFDGIKSIKSNVEMDDILKAINDRRDK